MIKFDRDRQVTKAFQRIGIWFIPLLSTPLLLSLVLVQTLSPSVHKANTSNTSSNNAIANVSTVSQWEPLVQQDLNKSNSPAKQTNKLKTNAKTVQKPSVKANKHTATKKRRNYKKVAKKAQYKPPAFEIRVAIANKVDSLTIGSSTEAYIMANNGKVLRSLPAAQAFNAIPNSSNIIIGNEQLPNAVWIYPTKGGAVYVGDRWYRGKLLLIVQENKLLAVNNVNLEQYLSSVVGSEMHPTAPMEALKAQAIAARSYALVHLVRPASSWYNLGNTQRWQVYKGMNSEYNTSHEAVKQTAGQFLSYKGGVVESLYAATDEIVAQAHGGMGMSQTGAYKLAAQGMNYTQILGYYYPGVQTARFPSQR
ncbi:MAG TPA: sporulation protein SpoIID [Cyanobacteria bacterium UBA11049]|nr:sporulation protein SpoIID [Cyanobacteria bacterium UBA11049]